MTSRGLWTIPPGESTHVATVCRRRRARQVWTGCGTLGSPPATVCSGVYRARGQWAGCQGRRGNDSGQPFRGRSWRLSAGRRPCPIFPALTRKPKFRSVYMQSPRGSGRYVTQDGRRRSSAKVKLGNPGEDRHGTDRSLVSGYSRSNRGRTNMKRVVIGLCALYFVVAFAYLATGNSSAAVKDAAPAASAKPVPLYNSSTKLEPPTIIDTPTALITRIADRGRDRHCREWMFHIYEHYLPFYWINRTNTIEVVDTVAKGGKTVTFNMTSLAPLNGPNLRAFFEGKGTVAQYSDNMTFEDDRPAALPGRRQLQHEYAPTRQDRRPHRNRVLPLPQDRRSSRKPHQLLRHRAPLRCRHARLPAVGNPRRL